MCQTGARSCLSLATFQTFLQIKLYCKDHGPLSPFVLLAIKLVHLALNKTFCSGQQAIAIHFIHTHTLPIPWDDALSLLCYISPLYFLPSWLTFQIVWCFWYSSNLESPFLLVHGISSQQLIHHHCLSVSCQVLFPVVSRL